MKVSDLISILQKADQNYDAQLVVSYSKCTIDEVLLDDGDSNVLIGNEIPPEMHGLDYKYEDA